MENPNILENKSTEIDINLTKINIVVVVGIFLLYIYIHQPKEELRGKLKRKKIRIANIYLIF